MSPVSTDFRQEGNDGVLVAVSYQNLSKSVGTLVMMQFVGNSRYRKRDRNFAVSDTARREAVMTGLRLTSMNLKSRRVYNEKNF